MTITAQIGETIVDTCEVTVTQPAFVTQTMTIDLGAKDYNIAKLNEAQTTISTFTVGSMEFNGLNVDNNGAGYNYLMLRNGNSGVLGNTLLSNKTQVPGAITKVEFTIPSGSSGSAIYNAIISATEVTSKVTDATFTQTGPGTFIVTADATANLSYFAISCVNNDKKNGQVASITVTYVPAA